MKSEIIKSRLDITKYIIAVAFSLALILTNLVGSANGIYTVTDAVLGRTIVNIRGLGIDTNIFFSELLNKNNVLEENLKLKIQISNLESAKAESESLKQKLADQEKKYSIKSNNDKIFKEVPVRGIQDLYNTSPSVYITLDYSNDYKIGQIVYYNKNQLFGFISEINGLSAKVIPFYSPNLDFRVPVQSLIDPTITGFVLPINKSEIHISNVNRNSSISKGDIWVTTNDRADVPGSLVVGKIKNIYEDKENGFKDLEIDAPFDLLTLETLLIIPNE